MSRDIIIYPNRNLTGATDQPFISFSGLSAGTISLVVEDDGSITFDGDTGSLFGISDNKDGLLHSVNDVSGLPIFQVYDDERIIMGKWDDPAMTLTSGGTVNINLDNVGGGTPLFNLGVDSSGDVVTGTTGGGETLAQTLAIGNTTGGIPISITSGDYIEFLPSGSRLVTTTIGTQVWDLPHATGTIALTSDITITGLTTTGTSGPSTLESGILNVPEYSGPFSAGTGTNSAVLIGGGNIATGTTSVAEGSVTIAGGDASHAEGESTKAYGYASHAEGQNTRASGQSSHAEGRLTLASGNYSHAQGYQTIASNDMSYAEGDNTKSFGFASHAEGQLTIASNNGSHAEGLSTTASGIASHAQGQNTTASGHYSHAGGLNSTASGVTSFIHSSESLVIGDRSVVLGGQNITGTTDDTVYVPNLNIGTVGSGTPNFNLGVDSSGNVVTGTTDGGDINTASNVGGGNNVFDQKVGTDLQFRTLVAGTNVTITSGATTLTINSSGGGGGGVTIDPYEDVGNVTSINWDVSGTSTNYEATLTGDTTLNMANVRNGDYGTLIVTQDGTGSHTLSLGAGTHKVVNGGGGSPTLTTTAGATDILSFTYNGTNFYWTVGNDYT